MLISILKTCKEFIVKNIISEFEAYLKQASSQFDNSKSMAERSKILAEYEIKKIILLNLIKIII